MQIKLWDVLHLLVYFLYCFSFVIFNSGCYECGGSRLIQIGFEPLVYSASTLCMVWDPLTRNRDLEAQRGQLSILLCQVSGTYLNWVESLICTIQKVYFFKWGSNTTEILKLLKACRRFSHYIKTLIEATETAVHFCHFKWYRAF